MMTPSPFGRVVAYTPITYFKISMHRCYSTFMSKFVTQNDIIYRNNIDVRCKRDIFFYTVLNVDNYKYFLPYITDSKITEKTERYLKANLQMENILFKEKYNSLIHFSFPKTITVSSLDTNIFHHLLTEWIITEKTGCINVDFYINFRLKNNIYQNFMHMYIKELGKKILYSFIRESRANSLKNVDALLRSLIKK
ncbi:coenzyme Q-binding protein COQ10 homolog, mitochondrial, putative [Plasmodium ovale]|uniref:Coenzyme Q-binding protein COQ10 homolog, mitochondrial, putative n=2 Tax=Plasmodium ovale TaxID=36330 RepID=A0A1C3KMG3_PLAOA|nr:coenzyme Q-binding protein COQ10 homolog, mitochondrial, putative [Plasmodium ovale]